ncbi:UNVERIFIED_CONTAM: hypothetical protein ACS92_06400 [Bacillus cereus]
MHEVDPVDVVHQPRQNPKHNQLGLRGDKYPEHARQQRQKQRADDGGVATTENVRHVAQQRPSYKLCHVQHGHHDGTLVAAQADGRAERRVREQHDGVRKVVHKAPRTHVLHGQRFDHVPDEQTASFPPHARVFRVEGPPRPH